MRTLEASGKTIDEAIFNGLKELEVSIDEVEIDIVQHETKGLLGIGAKPAIVRLIEREPEQIVIPDYLTDADRVRTGSRSGQRKAPPTTGIAAAARTGASAPRVRIGGRGPKEGTTAKPI